MNRLTCAVVGLAVIVGSSRAADPFEKAKEEKAALSAKSLETACEAFCTHPNSKNQYPKQLEDLVKVPWGGASYLKNGKADLIDPWGKPFRYAVRKDAKGNPKVYVWSERTVDGKTKVVGTKAPAEKKS